MRRFILAAVLFVLLGMSHKVFAQAADQWVAAGDAFLEANNISQAYNAYLNAYNLDNSHQGANFGLAVTTVPHFLIGGGDAGVTDFLADNNIFLIGTIYDLTVERTGDLQSTIPAIQNFLGDSVLPYIDQTIAYMGLLKTDNTFTKTITAAMYQGQEDIRLDHAAILAGESVMHLARGLINFVCAYDLDFNPEEEYASLREVLDDNPSLLTVKTGGNTNLNNSLVSFQTVLDNLMAGYDFVDGKTDPHPEDLFVFPPDDLELNYLRGEIPGLLADIRAVMNPGGKSIDFTDLIMKINHYSEGIPLRFPMEIDLSRLFTNPITRTNLDPLQFDEYGEFIFESLWGLDQTFNGVLADMTKPEFIGYLRGGAWLEQPEIFDEAVYLWGDIPSWGEDLDRVDLYRDSTYYVDDTSHLIGSFYPQEGNEWFEFVDDTATSDTYYYRTYTRYADGSYFMSGASRAAKKLYVNNAADGLWKGTAGEPYKYIGLALEWGNPGSTVYVAGGTYLLQEDPEVWGGLYIWKNRQQFIGSCNPNAWSPNMNSHPTIIDADGVWTGIGIQEWRDDIVIENFIVKNAGVNGIEIAGRNNTVKNCVIYNCGFSSPFGWGSGINLWNVHATGNRIINCTVADNFTGIAGARCHTIKNTIIANNEEEGVGFWHEPPLFFSHNNVWGNDPEYGMPDMTGLDGNISSNPLFVNPAAGDYRLAEGSPCIGAGEDGVDMGAFPYIVIDKGDINGDGVVNISDVILCLRMSIGLPVTVGVEEYIAPYPAGLINRADMNNDGVVNIADVILVLRKSVGLD